MLTNTISYAESYAKSYTKTNIDSETVSEAHVAKIQNSSSDSAPHNLTRVLRQGTRILVRFTPCKLAYHRYWQGDPNAKVCDESTEKRPVHLPVGDEDRTALDQTGHDAPDEEHTQNKTANVMNVCEDIRRLARAVEELLAQDDLTINQKREIADLFDPSGERSSRTIYSPPLHGWPRLARGLEKSCPVGATEGVDRRVRSETLE